MSQVTVLECNAGLTCAPALVAATFLLLVVFHTTAFFAIDGSRVVHASKQHGAHAVHFRIDCSVARRAAPNVDVAQHLKPTAHAKHS